MDFTKEDLDEILKMRGVNESAPKHIQIEFFTNVLEIAEMALKDMEERFKLGLEEVTILQEMEQMKKQMHIVRVYLHKLKND
jgi:hypothetical protein